MHSLNRERVSSQVYSCTHTKSFPANAIPRLTLSSLRIGAESFVQIAGDG